MTGLDSNDELLLISATNREDLLDTTFIRLVDLI